MQVPIFLRKPTAICYIPGGVWTPFPLWIGPCWGGSVLSSCLLLTLCLGFQLLSSGFVSSVLCPFLFGYCIIEVEKADCRLLVPIFLREHTATYDIQRGVQTPFPLWIAHVEVALFYLVLYSSSCVLGFHLLTSGFVL